MVDRHLAPAPVIAHGLSHTTVENGAMRWLVDGMNVIGTRPDAVVEGSRRRDARLVDPLERWAAAEGEDVRSCSSGHRRRRSARP